MRRARGASARGERAAHAAHAAHATRGRGVRAQAQAHDKQEEGKRDKARGTALAASSSLSDEFSGGERLNQRWGGAKMDAEAVVLKELKSGRNSNELANALSLLTSLS